VQSEATLLKRFEGFFLFEFYVRYLQRSQAFNKLLKLKESIRQRFIELQVVDMLEEYTFCDKEFPEDRYSLDIDLETLVRWTLDAIQISDCQLFRLSSDLFRVSLTEEHLDRLFTPFREHEESIEHSLQMLYYRFSHLMYPANDVSFVLEWWLENLDEDFRRKHKLLGKLGLASVQKDDCSEGNDADDVLHLSFPPFTAPEVLFFKKTNYELYDSDEAEVSVNGQQLVNSVVLSVQFDQSAENMDEILRAFLARFYGAQPMYILDTMDPGTYPSFWLKDKSKLVSSILEPPKDDYDLITRYDSISKLLSALVCYDAYRHRGGYESLVSVAEGILAKHQRIKLADATILEQNVYEIEKMINNINEIFRKKYPSEATRFHAG
jgi:hypothetical protein